MRKRNVVVVVMAGMTAAILVNYTLANIRVPRIKGATIERRVLKIGPDGNQKQIATETWQISSTGARREVKRDAITGKVIFEMLADPVRGGVYYIHRRSKYAEKASSYSLQSQLVTSDNFLRDPNFVREEEVLGYRAYLISLKDDSNHTIVADLWYVPEFGNFPFKWITYNEDGSSTMIEPVKVTLGEPNPTQLRLGNDFEINDLVSTPPLTLQQQK